MLKIFHNLFLFLKSTSFGVPPVLVDPNNNYQSSKKNKGPTSGYYPPIARVMPRVDRKYTLLNFQRFNF